MMELWRSIEQYRRWASILLVLLAVPTAYSQTTSGTASTGNTLFNSTFNCHTCHTASSAKRYNAINAGGHITYANGQGMGGTVGSAQNFADIGAYLATLFTDLAAQSVTFGAAKAISIPNIGLASSYGDYVGLRTVSGNSPTRGSVSYSGTTATYTPDANDCGFDTFKYEAYRSAGGTSNSRTVSLTISNPSAPVISSLGSKSSTVGLSTSYTITTTGGTPTLYGATSVPTGLTRSSSVISGTPTAAGNFSTTVYAYNCSNGNSTGQFDSQVVTWTVAKGTQAALTARINASSVAPTFTYSSPNGTATLSTIGGSGSGAVSYASSNTAVCTVTLTTQLNLVGAGTCTITATKASDANYNQIQDTIGVTVNKSSQTITFAPQTTASRSYVQSGTFLVSPTGTATSGLAVTYDSNTPGVCTLPGTTSTTVTMVSAGTCTIGANQAGNTNYAAATEVPQSVTINPILPQPPTIGTGVGGNALAVVNFTAPTNTGGTAIIDYTATCTASGQTTRTATVASSPATVMSMTNGVTYSCSVTARNSVGTSATASGTVMVTPTSSPVITSQNNTTFTIGSNGNFTVTTTGAPTPTLSMSGTLPSGVSFNAVTGVLSGTPAAGTAGSYPLNFTATNAGGSSMQSFTLTVQKASQTITFGTIANRVMRPVSFGVSATASSGLTVTLVIAAATSGNCSLAGGNLTMTNIGTCTVLADQAGNTSYSAATQVSRSFTISQGTQSIVFTTQGTQTYAPSGTFSLNPVGVSVDPTDLVSPTGLTVSRASLTTGVCTIAPTGTTVTIVAGGTCTIQVSQAGNANYAAALPVSQDITINQANQTISWGAQSDQTFGTGGTFAISPTATGGASGNAITYGSNTTSVCTVSGTTVTKVRAGTCTLTANQSGDGNYTAATQVNRTLTIGPSRPTAPNATTIVATDSQVVIEFEQPSSDGGSAITNYQATCLPGTITANGTSSPLKVVGLTNGVPYNCTVRAQNVLGFSAASNTLMATPFLETGANMWLNVCSDCHGATPAGVRFNAAGTTGNVINYVRSVQSVMLAESRVQAFTLNELGEIAKYIATFVPAISVPTPFNTPVNVNVSSHLTLGTVSFTIAAVATPPTNGTLSAFSGTQITYTPNAGFVGVDTFTYRGTGNAPMVNGDPRTVTVTVAPPPAPVITSPAIAAGTFGVAFAYQITATNSPTSFAAAPLGSFTINTMTGAIAGTPMAAGSFTVTVSATNAGGTGMQSVDVTISKVSQTITFGAQGGQSFSPGGSFMLNPVATGGGSSNAVTYSSLTPSVCSISGTTVTMLTAGTCTIAADQSGNTNYEAALQVTRPIAISATVPGAPTIGAATPGDTVAAIGFTPPANNGGSAITGYIASCLPGPFVGNGTASPITVTQLVDGTPYTCSVRASNAIGTGAVSGTVMVTPTATLVAPQITSANATTFTVGAASTFTVTATGTPPPTLALSGMLPTGVTFTAMTGVLAGTPALGQVGSYPVTITATGTAPAAMQSFTLTVQKADQTISFNGPSSQPFTASTIPLMASASSFLTVTLASNTPLVCTISSTTLTLLSVGTCSITASQAGNANYNAAPSVTQGFTVSQASQTINFAAQVPASRGFVAGSTFGISPLASASSGLAVIYSSTTTGICTVVGTTVTMVAPGTCTIAANQSGSANFLPVAQVTQNVSLNATVPGAPVIGTATGGNAQATVNFTAPANNGGSAIIDYTATCAAISVVGNASPIVVSGLANGVMQNCSVTARNSVGSSASSATVSVTPLSGQGSALWTQVCDVCHTSVPSGHQLNGAGTSATVINYVRANQTSMALNSAVQALSNADLVDIATYIATVVPTNNVTTTVSTAVLVDVNNHISLTNQPWSAFTSVEIVTGPSQGALGAFTGTQVQYTPNPGYLGSDSFTYRGKNTGTGVNGDPQTVSISVNPPPPSITSSTNTIGVFGVAFNYQITATNSPTSFGVNGLPGGLSVDAAGLITGIPTVPGQFSVSISAANGGGTGGATLTLQIDPAPQTIIFGAQTSPRTYSVGGSFTISPLATGGATMNPIVYGSSTQSVCTVSSITVTMVAAGICTITADQSGNTNYAAATQATRNVTINATLPAAPVIGIATAGNTVASIAFTPAANNTGSPITSYNASCTPGAVGSNTVSPINLSGLTNNTQYTCSVTATNSAGTSGPSGNVVFTPVAVVAPGAPTIGIATAGDAQATIAFTPPASDGGGTITSYTTTCTPGNFTASNNASPITVSNLVNGTPYICSVTATNSAGTGLPSAGVSVTPLPPLALISVVSRKLHGNSTPRDVPINHLIAFGGSVDVEPRAIGSGHTLVFTFNNPITAEGNASVNVGAATPAPSGNTVVVTLTGIADNQRAMVTLTNVNGDVTTFSASLGFLIGDVNNTRSVNASDISAVKARLNKPTDGTNFKSDVNTSGTIDPADVSAVKARSGVVLPP